MAIERFIWTVHALQRLPDRGLTRATVEDAIAAQHPMRAPNTGAAHWLLDAGRFVVVYDHPCEGDMDAVRIVTTWRKRRRPRRHLRAVKNEIERYPR